MHTHDVVVPAPPTPSPDDDALKVRELLAEACAVDPDAIGADKPLIDYGLDSARAIELIVALEDAFGVRISDEAAASMKTLSDIVAFVRATRK
jgi:acyl carrier protein